ncbi:MAG: AGE family epimerase/isomerase [Promicromonosporaceae bacterium]|nr:AGE family epimerase/isomerase [Promicromonosporaceae bacterium]
MSVTTAWLEDEARRLLSFGAAAALPDGGAAYLDEFGVPDLTQGIQAWITCRTVHSFALGHLLGVSGANEVAKAALAGLWGQGAVLRDTEHGGWFNVVSADGTPDPTADKLAYDHAFVMLAGASATIAGIEGGAELLTEACAVYLEKFWDDAAGRPIDTWNADFTKADPYRGLNSTMHSIEALLTVANAVPAKEAPAWLDRAERSASFVVDLAAAHNGRLPEHFGPDWVADLELNKDRPGDRFKPYGATPGHGFEWARLLLHLEAALASPMVDPAETTGSPSVILRERSESQNPAPLPLSATTFASVPCAQNDVRGELLPTAIALFDRAVADAWAADGADGFAYTTGWDGIPVVRARMHWVVCEAIATAHVLHERTGEQRFADWYERFVEYAKKYLLDQEHGSWHHELDSDNRPAATVWPGKPDIYHALQCVLIPRLPLFPMLPAAMAAGSLLPAASFCASVSESLAPAPDAPTLGSATSLRSAQNDAFI